MICDFLFKYVKTCAKNRSHQLVKIVGTQLPNINAALKRPNVQDDIFSQATKQVPGSRVKGSVHVVSSSERNLVLLECSDVNFCASSYSFFF